MKYVNLISLAALALVFSVCSTRADTNHETEQQGAEAATSAQRKVDEVNDKAARKYQQREQLRREDR